MSFIYNMTDTWNNIATTFTAIKMNVTDTNSAAASLVMDLQIASLSIFSVGKNGITKVGTTNGVLSAGTNGFGTLQIGGSAFGNNGEFAIRDGGGIVTRGAGWYGWENGGNNPATGTVDLFLFRDAANTFAQRNSTNAQIFSVYNTFTDVSNYERAEFNWVTTANRFILQTAAAGTGTIRDFQVVAGASGGFIFAQAAGNIALGRQGVGIYWNITALGHFTAGIDNTYDIGASGATRPRNIYVAGTMNVNGQSNLGTIISSGSIVAGAGNSISFNGRTALFSASDGVALISNNAATDFTRLQFGGITSSFPSLKRSTTALQARLADDSAFTNIQGKLTTDTAYTATPQVPTGFLTVYDSTGTAYKIPANV